MSSLSRVMERVRQNRTEQRAAIGRNDASSASAEVRIGLRFAPGARVFDRRSGEEGIVLGGTRESLITPAPEPAND